MRSKANADLSPAFLPMYQEADDVPCPSGWTVLRIEDLYDQLSIGKRYSGKSSRDTGSVPVIDQSLAGIIGFHDDEPGIDASSESPVVTFANHSCAMRVMRTPFSVIQNVFPLVGRSGVCTTLYLYYATNGRQPYEEYKGHFPSWRASFLPVPPLSEQRRIASVLGTFDDKIDSKRRIIKSLEALIGEMFNERFFGLVGARPQWDRGILSDLVRQHKERCPASELTASLPYVPIDLIASRSFMLENQRPGDEARSSLTEFEPGDILFGAMRPYFHKVALAPFRGVTRTTVFVLRSINERDWAYVSLLLSQPDTIEFATRTSRGSTIPYAAWDGVLSEMPVDLPPPAERAAFDEVARPTLTFIQNSCFELGTLAEIRDALLPKLISGEIRAPDTHDPDEVIGPAAERLAAATL
jgi:hypothetical protein